MSFIRRMIAGGLGECIAWACLWFVARGLLVISFADVFNYGEEFEKACAGKAMLDGLGIPHHQLAYQYYEGGGFVISHLDALAFAVLGESVLAVKVVALIFGAAILGAGWKLCDRLAGRGGARIFALLFILAPISVQKLSLLTLGIHFHALLFVALVLDATARIILERDLSRMAWLKLGLVAGFGLYFSYQLVLTLVVCAVALIVCLRGDVLRRATWLVLVGFLLGLAPFFWMLAHVGTAVFDIHGSEILGESAAAKFERVQGFFQSIFVDRSALDLAALSVLGISPLLGCFALGASNPRGLRLGAWIVLGHIGLFLLAYFASSFTVGPVYHYFVLSRLTPLWWLAAIFTTLGAIAAWNSRRAWQRTAAVALVAVLSIFGIADLRRELRGALEGQPSFRLAHPGGNLKILARTEGYAYPKYLYKIAPHLAGSTADKLRVFQRFDEPRGSTSTLLYEGIAIGLYCDGSLELEGIERELRAGGIDDLRGFYLGLGLFLRFKFPRDIAMRAAGVASKPPEVRDALIEGLGCAGIGVASEDRLAREVEIGIDSKLPELFFVGLGRRMHAAFATLSGLRYHEMRAGPWMLQRERAVRFATGYPEPIATALLRGYDTVHHERWIDPKPWWLILP